MFGQLWRNLSIDALVKYSVASLSSLGIGLSLEGIDVQRVQPDHKKAFR